MTATAAQAPKFDKPTPSNSPGGIDPTQQKY
jgi:hypothetical protein